jgi:hypothetical protein
MNFPRKHSALDLLSAIAVTGRCWYRHVIDDTLAGCTIMHHTTKPSQSVDSFAISTSRRTLILPGNAQLQPMASRFRRSQVFGVNSAYHRSFKNFYLFSFFRSPNLKLYRLCLLLTGVDYSAVCRGQAITLVIHASNVVAQHEQLHVRKLNARN